MTKARNIAELANDISVDSNRDVTLSNLRSDQPMMFRNKIINGDMRIDQRNAGSAVTGSTAGSYTIDRWTAFQNYGTVTIQQSTTAPSGFRNSYYTTVTSPASVGVDSIYSIVQHIEGSNISDLNFGSSAAKNITISFQVRSSITGTYGVFLRNSAQDRYYTSTFSISLANTFETKIITLAGDNQGTWLTDTGTGLTFGIVLGAGVNRQGTENTWTGSSSGPFTTSSQIDWMSNSGATFYITGVQLEEGTVATPFEHRPYGTELALCQRYYQKLEPAIFACTTNGTEQLTSVGVPLSVSMRATPTGESGDFPCWHSTANVIQNTTTPVFSYTAGRSSVRATINGYSGLTDNRVAVVYFGANVLDAEIE